MAVYFVYRSHYQNPGGKHVKTFAADTVLDWFRSVWKPIPETDPGGNEYPARDHADPVVYRHLVTM